MATTALSPSTFTIRGDITTTGNVGINAGVKGAAKGAYSDAGIAIDNEGDIESGTIGLFATTETTSYAEGAHSNAGIAIHNTGDITIAANSGPAIFANTLGNANGAYSNTGIAIDNEGDLQADVFGISASIPGRRQRRQQQCRHRDPKFGDIDAATQPGIDARTYGNVNGANGNAGIEIDNSGDIALTDASSTFNSATGIHARSRRERRGRATATPVSPSRNSGDIGAGDFRHLCQDFRHGVGDDANTGIEVDNTGAIAADTGIYARTFGNAATAPSSDQPASKFENRTADIVSNGTSMAGAIYTSTSGNATGARQQRQRHRHRQRRAT